MEIPDHAAEILYLIAGKEGIGETLAKGIKPASKFLQAEDLAIHVKGMEPAGYDPRVLKGMALGYAVSPRGACHLPATFYIFELRSTYHPSAVKGKAEAYISYEDRLSIMDTMITCRFFRDMLGWNELITLIKATTGLVFTEEELKKTGGNISTLRHLFNIREGWTREDDMLPARFFDEAVGGKSLTREEFNYTLDDYYHLRGWDTNGKVLNEIEF